MAVGALTEPDDVIATVEGGHVGGVGDRSGFLESDLGSGDGLPLGEGGADGVPFVGLHAVAGDGGAEVEADGAGTGVLVGEVLGQVGVEVPVERGRPGFGAEDRTLGGRREEADGGEAGQEREGWVGWEAHGLASETRRWSSASDSGS